jgi:hypothetical protein
LSKFDSLFEARGAGGGAGKKGSKAKKGGKAQAAGAESRKRGRPSGKRSDPDYVGFTTYIRKDTHHEVKLALLQEKEGRELSELVEELLTGWLKSRPKK